MIHLMPNFHFDLTWHKNRDTFFRISSEIFREALDLLQAETQYHFTIDHSAFLDRYIKKYPEDLERIKRFVQNNQLSLVGGMVSMMDCDIPDGEVFARQLLYGQHWFENTFAQKPRVGWLIDNYGYTAQIPQILRLAGINYLEICLWWVPAGYLSEQIRSSEFRWQGLDGSQILVHVAMPNYTGPVFPGSRVYDEPPTLLSPEEETQHIIHNILEWQEKVRPWASSEALLGHVGGDFRHPSPRLVEQIRSWNDLPENSSLTLRQITLSGPEPFFDKLDERKDTLPVFQGEISPEMRTIIKTPADLVAIATSPFHVRPAALGRFGEGYGETKVERKQLDRAFHYAARQAEQALTWQAWLEGSTPATRISTLLAELYQPVLEFGHHDPFIGCCVIEDYEQQIALLRNSISRANGLCFKAYQAITSQVDTQKSGQPCIIFNSQSWDRQELVSITLSFEPGVAFDVKVFSDTGLPLASQMVDPLRYLDGSLASVDLLISANVPACGYQTVFLHFKEDEPGLATPSIRKNKESFTLLENNFYRVEFHPSGSLTGIYDKIHQRALLGPGGGELVFEEDLGCFCHIDPDGISWKQSDFPPAKIEIEEEGPLRWRCVIENHGKGCSYQLEITIYEHSPFIELRLSMNIHSGEDLRARYHFTLPGPCQQIWAETPFGAILRESGLSHAINWVDCQGEDWKLALLNQGLSNYEIRGRDLWLTLWRGLSLFADCSGCLPRDQRQPLIECGNYEFRFALLPHKCDWQESQLVQSGLAFNQPMQTVLTDTHNGKIPPVHSWLSIEPATIILVAVKFAETSEDLVVRLYESTGRQSQALLHLPPGVEAWQEVNLLEEKLTGSIPVHNQTISLCFRPFEIKTVLLMRKLNG